VPTEAYIYIEDLNGLAKVGKDVLADSDQNLEAYIAQSFAIARAAAEARAFAIGTGHAAGKQPDGIAVDATLRTGLTTGCGVAADQAYGISWATDDTVLINDLLKCEYKLPVQYLSGASWLWNRKTELAARILQAAGTGQYLWQPSLLAGQPNNFDGFPIYNSSDMNYPADTLAATNVVFGNFRLGYAIIDHMGITLQRLDELYAEAGLVGFLCGFRVGGGLMRYDTFQLIVNDV
jgi:HK97 family phage major capsid protein